MKAYKLKYRLKSYLSVDIDNKELRAKLGKIVYPAGDPMRDIWQQPQGRLYNQYYDNDEGKLPEISDWVGNMVLSPGAYEALRSHLEAYGELLPVSIDAGQGQETWYIFNATTICNAVDETRSERDIMDGMIMGIHSLAFDSNAELPLVFRTDYDRRIGVYCNQVFNDLVQTARFEAVLFRENLAAAL